MKMFVFSFFLFSFALLPGRQASAGWLIWKSPPYAAEPAGQTEKKPGEIINLLPEKAVYADLAPACGINLLIIGKQFDIRNLMGNGGWVETSSSFIEAAGAALMKLSSGVAPLDFPPVKKMFLHGSAQDMNFVREGEDGRIVLRVWRLPYTSSRGVPAWAAASDEQTGELKKYFKPFKTSFLYRAAPGEKKSKANKIKYLVLEIPR